MYIHGRFSPPAMIFNRILYCAVADSIMIIIWNLLEHVTVQDHSIDSCTPCYAEGDKGSEPTSHTKADNLLTHVLALGDMSPWTTQQFMSITGQFCQTKNTLAEQ